MIDPWVRAVLATVTDHRIPGPRAARRANGSVVPGGPAHLAALLNAVLAEAARCLRCSASAARGHGSALGGVVPPDLRGRVHAQLCSEWTDAGTDVFVVWLDERRRVWASARRCSERVGRPGSRSHLGAPVKAAPRSAKIWG